MRRHSERRGYYAGRKPMGLTSCTQGISGLSIPGCGSTGMRGQHSEDEVLGTWRLVAPCSGQAVGEWTWGARVEEWRHAEESVQVAPRPRREQQALGSEPPKGRVFQERATQSAVKASLALVRPQACFKLPAYQALGIFDTATFNENVLPHLYFTLWLYDASVVLLVVFDDLSASLEPMFVLLA